MKNLATLVLVAGAFGSVAAPAQDADLSGSVRKITPAKLDKKQQRMDSFFPGEVDREALVYVGVKISEQGEVTETRLLDGGFHDRRFSDAALKVARRLKFVPAQSDGTAVTYEGIVPIRFSVPQPGGKPIQGVTPEFQREAKKVQTLIEQKDLAGAHFHAQWMLSEKVKLGFEYAVLQSTLAYTHARAGNVHRALKAARDVTAHTGMSLEKYQPGGPLPQISMRDFLLTKELLDQMLKLRFVLATSQGFYLDAVRAQADRMALKLAAPDDSYATDTTKLLAALEAAPSLRAHARIDEEKGWSHDLWFNRFAVRSLSGGSLSGMLLTCDGYSRSLEYVEGAEWTVPARWSSCRLQFEGTSGAEFDIMEYRNAPEASPSEGK